MCHEFIHTYQMNKMFKCFVHLTTVIGHEDDEEKEDDGPDLAEGVEQQVGSHNASDGPTSAN